MVIRNLLLLLLFVSASCSDAQIIRTIPGQYRGASNAAPVNQSIPTVSGSKIVGATLTATPGTFSGAGISNTYQWKRDGVVIDTGLSHIITASDDSKDLIFVHTATNSSGSASANSATQAIRDYVSATGQEVWWCIGDSKSRGTTTDGLKGPEPTAGTVYEYNGTSIVQVGAADVLNAVTGSPYPQFGINYNISSSKKPVFSCTGVSSARFYHSTTVGLSWYTNGTLYATGKTKTDGALTAAGTGRPKVWIILGINDIASAETIGTVLTSITSLIDRINTDYSSPEIYINIPGLNTLATNARFGTIRWAIKDLGVTYTNVHVVVNEASLYSWGIYGSDNLHFVQPGYNKMAEILDRYVTSTEPDKDIRRILAGFDTPLNPTKAAAVKAFVTAEKANGNWLKYDMIEIFVGDTRNNSLMELIGTTSPYTSTAVEWNIQSNMRTDGSATFINSFFRPAYLTRNITLDNSLFMCKNGVNLTSAGTLGFLYGATSGARNVIDQTAASILEYRNYSSTKTYSGETKFANNAWYGTKRTASNASALVKNGTDVDNTTSASITLTTDEFYLGARNGTNVAFEFLNCEYKVFFGAAAVGFNLSASLTNFDTMITALSQP